MDHQRFSFLALWISVSLFVSMLVFLELGRQLGARSVARHGEDGRAGIGAVQSVVNALLALLIGFVFAGATGRFDERRNMIIGETSAISTAWQRIDMLPAEMQPPIRVAFRQYVDQLVTTYGARDTLAASRHRADLTQVQNDLWARSTEAVSLQAGERARMLLLPSLNEMFDAVDKEFLARLIHPPRVIYVMLFVTALVASLFAGYTMANRTKRNWIYMVGIAATISLSMFVIIELEFPRMGMVRLDAIDRTLVDLRMSMN